MFGFSFSELIVVVLVALVVMGPKDLPKMLRRVGQWAGKIRRAAADLRASSGIDDALRSEGLADDIAEIRKLARGELDAVQKAARIDANDRPGGAAARNVAAQNYDRGDDFYVVRDREYPREGADCYFYGAIPDNAIFYSENSPRSAVGREPLYVLGDADGVLPPEPVLGTLPGVGVSELDRQAQSENLGHDGHGHPLTDASNPPNELDVKTEEPGAVAGAAPVVPAAPVAPVTPAGPVTGGVGPTLMGVGVSLPDSTRAGSQPDEGERRHGDEARS